MTSINLQQSNKARTFQSWIPLVLVVLIVILAKLPTLHNNIIFIDEPAYLAEARRLDSLEAFIFSFEHRTQTKFQLGLVPYMLAQLISHSNAILIVRLLGIGATIISCWLIMLLSQHLFRSLFPSFVALCSWLLFLNSSDVNIVPLLEYFQTPVILLCVWLFARILQQPHKSFGLFFWLGVCIAVAALIKPPAIVISFVVSFFMVFYHSDFFVDWKAGIKAYCLLAVGLALPLCIFILPYSLNPAAFGELKFSLVDAVLQYNRAYKNNAGLLANLGSLLLELQLANIALMGLAAGWWVYHKFHCKIEHSKSRQTISQEFLLATGAALFLAYASGQAKTHYLIPVLPLLMLPVSDQLRNFYQKVKLPKKRNILVVLAVVWLSVFQVKAWLFYGLMLIDSDGKVYAQQLEYDKSALVNYIQTNSSPQDMIWVFFDAPEVYWFANRKPATNDPLGAFILEFDTNSWIDRTYEQLERDKAKVLVLFEETRFSYKARRNIVEFPRLQKLLDEKYMCSQEVIAQATICKRVTI